MGYSKNRFAKVKSLARRGWVGGPKPKKKKKGSMLKKAVSTVASVAKKEGKMALGVLKDQAKRHGNAAADAAIRSAGAAASVTTGNPLPSMAAEASIIGKDYLLEQYFGAQSNKTSSHSGRNYAVKRKPLRRYHSSVATTPQVSERLFTPSPMIRSNRHAAQLRNSNHTYSAPHPTGSKV